MSSGDKKDYQKPELLPLGNAEEAIAYYSARGMREHVEAVKRLASDAKQRIEEADDQRRRAAGRR